MARQPGELFTRSHRPRISNAPLARQHDLYVNYATHDNTFDVCECADGPVDRIPCATNHDSHRAAPRCARARLTRYHRHPCVSHYGSGCWPRGQPNKIYEPNTQRRTSAVSNWNCTAQLAQQRWWVGTGIDSNCHRCSNPKRLHTNPTTVSNGRVPNRCTISTFTSSRRKGPTGTGASAGGGERSPS